MELNLAGSRFITHPPAAGRSPLLKFDWSPEATERLRFSSPHFLLQIQLLEARLSLPSPDTNQIVSDLSTLLLDTTKQVVKFRKRGPPSHKQKSARKWYDPSLCTLKAEVHKLCLQARSNPTPHLLQSICAKTKAYKSLLKLKARRFKQLLQGKMASTSDKSPKEWWSLLKEPKANAKWEDPDQHASLEDLTSFFRSLYKDTSLDTDAQCNPDLTFSCSDYFRTTRPSQPVQDDPMEQPITQSEVSQVIKHLSLGKATGLDNISNEMIKLAGPIHLPFFTRLFNHIYSTACFPSIWKQAYISTLHKKGAKQDPANYRPLLLPAA